MRERDVSARCVIHHFEYGQGPDPVRIPQQRLRERLVQRMGRSHAGSEGDAGPIAIGVGELVARVSYRFGRSGQGELRDAIEPLQSLLRREIRARIEGGRRGDIGVGAGTFEGNLRHSRLPSHQPREGRLRVIPQRGDEAKAGHDDPARVHWPSEGVAPCSAST
jgi:hypothetical protein